MANAVNVNFRMDADLKTSMEEVCEEMGMSITTAFTIFAKKVTRERKIPFEITADPFFSRENLSMLEKRVRDVQSGRSSLKEHELIEVGE